MSERKLILISNDDGIHAKGLWALVDAARAYGDVVVVAPNEGMSGMSHAITFKVPIRVNTVKQEADLEAYSCNGTPVDCVKIALDKLLKGRVPNLILSGVNHGSNTAGSVLYSGTIAAAMVGLEYGIKSVAFSLLDFDKDADFEPATPHIKAIIEHALRNELGERCCWNVNIPKGAIKGIRPCRHAKGRWHEEFVERVDPQGRKYYWLSGYFANAEPQATDTDEFMVSQGYIAVSTVGIDFEKGLPQGSIFA